MAAFTARTASTVRSADTLREAAAGSTFNDSGTGTITLTGTRTESQTSSTSRAGTITLFAPQLPGGSAKDRTRALPNTHMGVGL